MLNYTAIEPYKPYIQVTNNLQCIVLFCSRHIRIQDVCIFILQTCGFLYECVNWVRCWKLLRVYTSPNSTAHNECQQTFHSVIWSGVNGPLQYQLLNTSINFTIAYLVIMRTIILRQSNIIPMQHQPILSAWARSITKGYMTIQPWWQCGWNGTMNKLVFSRIYVLNWSTLHKCWN